MSDKLNTVDIKTGGGFTPKTLQPGNTVCKITSVELKEFRLAPGGYEFLLHMEGQDLGDDFEGFLIDKNDPSKGHHHCQVGTVKASEWAFKDGETKSGIPVKRDVEILKFMKNLCTALNIVDWLQAQNNKHATIEDLIGAFNAEKPFKDIYLNCCLAGREYLNKSGYKAYDLFFPKFSQSGVPFEKHNPDAKSTKVVTFKESEHIKRKGAQNVTGFSGGDPLADDGGADQFQL